MKSLAIAVVIVIVMMVALQFKSDTVSYVNEGTLEVQTVEVSPEWATDEDAVKAAQDVIKRKQLEAELKAKDEQILKAEEDLKELKNERKALTTELTQY